jgi:hypothetical protein
MKKDPKNLKITIIKFENNKKQPNFIDIIVLLKLWALETLSLCKSKH